MGVRRVVPNVRTEAVAESREFYGLLGFEEVMNHGWIMTMASPDHPSAQVSVMVRDKTGPVDPELSIEVDDVDAAYAVMLERGAEIVHPLQDEEWGCGASSSATRQAGWSTCSAIGERAGHSPPAATSDEISGGGDGACATAGSRRRRPARRPRR